MKRIVALLLLVALCVAIVACTAPSAPSAPVHKIGVAVYDLNDEEVAGFRSYLEEYIGNSFEDVDFLYSQSISTQEEETEFLRSCIENGAEGIMAFTGFDLEAAVKLCAENGIYYMKASGTVSRDEFESVAENPYFLGCFGPGIDMEYAAGADMAEFFLTVPGDRYFILSGGASMGNTMHLERTKGILDTLQKGYGVSFDRSSEELALSEELVVLNAGKLQVVICGGYVGVDKFLLPALGAYAANPYKNVLSVLPVEGMAQSLRDAKVGVIDFYSDRNLELFSQGDLQYVCGKYRSIIGPAFAAMYNAVCGHSEDFRENGRAFQITQGFWSSDNLADYEEKFAMSAGIALNAYSFDDILDVIRSHSPQADLDDLKNLAQAYDFESALARRSS